MASIHVEDIEYAYPVPTIRRDEALEGDPAVASRSAVFTREDARAWRYEHGNMDHAVKMGIDIARKIVTGVPETLKP